MFPLECPPQSLRPDRAEVITPLGKGEKIDICGGSTLEYLVGKFNGARNLTTAIVNLAPGVQLDYHTHLYTEAVTVLEGALLMEVEGRRYKLGPLDNLVIPAGLAHLATNPSTTELAVLHGALATEILGRTLVDNTFSAQDARRSDRPGRGRIRHAATNGQAVRAGRRRELHRLLQRESRAGHRDERRLRPVPARWTIAGPRTRLRRVDLHHARQRGLRRGRAAVHAFRLRYGLAATRPRALFYQRIESADGHDLGLCRPPAGTNGRGRTVRDGGRQPVEIGGRTMPENKFVVTMTADFFDAAGCPKYRDLGLAVFDGQEHVERRVFSEHRPEVGPDQIGDAQGVIVLTPRVTAHSVSRPEKLLAIGRFGVGYDSVDVAACTAADVLLFITAGAVDRPVAEAVVGWMIALAHNVRIKDSLVRTGRWDDRSRHMGSELRERTLGMIGLGGIARRPSGCCKALG